MISNINIRRLVCSAVILAALLVLCGCDRAPNDLSVDPVVEMLAADRPPEATASPDFSNGVTDVRITAVPRSLVIYKEGTREVAEAYEDVNFLQIYYGYQSNGIWYDIPRENYDLRGINSFAGKTGYDAADGPHVVQIGPYLLVYFTVTSSYRNFSCEITDTLGSEAHQIFEEYYTVFSFPDETKYGYLKEQCDEKGQLLHYKAYNTFGYQYYVLLQFDDIPENYELNMKTSMVKDGVTKTYERTLTYEDIVQAFDDSQ